MVFDTTAARYVWEVPYYPQYYIPLGGCGFRCSCAMTSHPQRVQFGPSRIFSLVAPSSGTVEAEARVFDAGDGPVAGLVRFEWDG